MRVVSRALQPTVLEAARSFPSVVLTGPRRAGKTTLLRRLFPRATYVLLEDPDIQARARSDPRGLLDQIRLPAVFDEIQNVPELFAYVRSRVDAEPRAMGRWLFTGSQEAPLIQGQPAAWRLSGSARTAGPTRPLVQFLPANLHRTRRPPDPELRPISRRPSASPSPPSANGCTCSRSQARFCSCSPTSPTSASAC